MRVLIINKFLYPNGGSETYIFKLGEALEQHGHEVQYFGIFYIGNLMLYCLWLSYAIGSNSKFLSSKLMKFLSSISMEMYLAQMVIFRVVEKLHLLYVFGDTGISGWSSFLLAFVLTVFGLICFIECYKKRLIV